MHTTIYLTHSEQERYNLLPESLREGWTVVEETGTSYETLSELQIRYSLADFTFHPEMRNLAERIVNGEKPELISFDMLSPDVQSELFFVLGAHGTDAMIQSVLSDISADDDVELLAVLSEIRHKHLELNSSVTNH
ncbi:hypothetical protein K8942_03745 [Candidatus Peribacteria bacterium]|nr:MAG: hypothetical protein K8942_03745 [Candidatus Peribacteria bacterium]